MTSTRAGVIMPVLAICGHSGAGKTTLIERLVPDLRGWGWQVAVVKRTRHPVAFDVAGKDSDRFFRAGASVGFQADGELVTRVAAQASADDAWQRIVAQLVASHDFVLIEGHKETALPKVWLLGPGERAPPAGVANVLVTLGRDDDRRAVTRAMCQARATRAVAERPLLGALVLDRACDRAHAADALVALARCVARVVIVGGDHDWPSVARLPPVPAVTPRWLAHSLAALRWCPDAAWLLVRPGPSLTADRLAALVAQRRPGQWTIEIGTGGDATLHEPQARALLEDAADDPRGWR